MSAAFARAALASAVAGLLAVAPAAARSSAGASFSITPASVRAGGSFELVGTGYPVPTSISFEVTGPRKAATQIHYFTSGEPLTDPCGCFDETWTATWSVTGTFQITSYYRDSKGATHKVGVAKLTVTS